MTSLIRFWAAELPQTSSVGDKSALANGRHRLLSKTLGQGREGNASAMAAANRTTRHRPSPRCCRQSARKLAQAMLGAALRRRHGAIAADAAAWLRSPAEAGRRCGRQHAVRRPMAFSRCGRRARQCAAAGAAGQLWKDRLAEGSCARPAPAMRASSAMRRAAAQGPPLRRSEWREQPLFALIHQTYLMLAEQIMALADDRAGRCRAARAAALLPPRRWSMR